MKATTMKFANAYEWFVQWSATLTPEQALYELREFALAAGSDEIQDRYQREMDADGYFDEQEEVRS